MGAGGQEEAVVRAAVHASRLYQIDEAQDVAIGATGWRSPRNAASPLRHTPPLWQNPRANAKLRDTAWVYPSLFPVPLMKRGTIITIVALVAFGALLLFNTLSAQKVECTVCVEFNGQRNCATASHANQSDATASAQNTACGVLVSGMNESIACGRVTPISVQCKTR